MTEEHGRYWIVFNKEICNFPELRTRLEAAGHRFVSNSDTEVIVYLVEENGADFAKHLRGMFAVVVWDSAERTLLLVRDRLGIKPLYYQVEPDRLLFSSEAQTLPGAAGRLDEDSVAAYLALGWVPGPRSIYPAPAALGMRRRRRPLRPRRGRAVRRVLHFPPCPAHRRPPGSHRPVVRIPASRSERGARSQPPHLPQSGSPGSRRGSRPRSGHPLRGRPWADVLPRGGAVGDGASAGTCRCSWVTGKGA